MTKQTEYDQREELHAALGHKMMGTSSIGRAAGSNPAAAETPGAGSLPASPATYIDADTGAQVSADWWPGMPHDA